MDSLNRHPPATEAVLTVVDVDVPASDTTEQWAAGETRRIGIPTNVGYAKACNTAAQGGTGDVIALFNADVELTEDALDACHDALMANDSWGVLGPCQVDHQQR